MSSNLGQNPPVKAQIAECVILCDFDCDFRGAMKLCIALLILTASPMGGVLRGAAIPYSITPGEKAEEIQTITEGFDTLWAADERGE